MGMTWVKVLVVAFVHVTIGGVIILGLAYLFRR
jgi:hypothetical protein